MNCPLCSSEMDEGKAYVRGTVLGFLIAGFSHQHCWFKSHSTNKTKIIVRCKNGSGSLARAADAEFESRPAYLCEDCGTSIVVGTKNT